MRITHRVGKWGGRIMTALMLGLAAVVFGAILLEEYFGVDLEPVLARLTATLEGMAGALGLEVFQLLYLLLGSLLALAGLFTVATKGLPELRRALNLLRNDPIPIDELHLADGTVEVEGTAQRLDGAGTVGAPYSGTDCLGFRYEFTERQRRHNGEDRWRTREEGQRAVPFTVADESGSVVVDPSDATLTCNRDIVVSSGRRKKTEWRLEPGESVYVSGSRCDGTSDPNAPGDATTYIGAGDDPSTFTVSDASEPRTILRFTAKGLVFSIAGLVFLGAGAGMIYVTLLA